jgi:hypothetical protein
VRCAAAQHPLGSILRSCIRALAPLLLALPLHAFPALAVAADTPRVAVYATRMDAGAPLKRGPWNSGYGGGADVTWPIPRSQGLLAIFGGAEVSSLYSGQRAVVDTTSGDRAEHDMDQLYSRVFLGGELGPHGDGTLEPYANLALGMVVYGFADEVRLTTGGVTKDLYISQHEVGAAWSAGAGVNLNFRRFGVTGGVSYLRHFSWPEQLGSGTVQVKPAYVQYRVGITAPFPVEP